MPKAIRTRFKSEQRTKENDDYEESEEDGKEAGEEGEIIGDDSVQVGEAPWPGRGASFCPAGARKPWLPSCLLACTGGSQVAASKVQHEQCLITRHYQ
jgi:hypothetical protein